MRLAVRPPISSPANVTEPAVGTYMPAMQLKIVLLPDPFGPISPTISPSLTSNETLETAVKPPKVLVRPLTDRRATRIARYSGQRRFGGPHRSPAWLIQRAYACPAGSGST